MRLFTRLDVNDTGYHGYYSFDIDDTTFSQLMEEYLRNVLHGEVSGVDFFDYLKKNNSEVAEEIYNAFILCLNNGYNDSNGNNEIESNNEPIKANHMNKHIVHIIATRISDCNDFKLDFSNLTEYFR